MRGLIYVLLRDWYLSKRLRPHFWNRYYSSSSRDFVPTQVMSFMNLGYLADPNELDDHDSADIADRLSALLYDRLVAGVPLEQLTVLEVGCGPGGGSAHLARTYHPASFTAVDLSQGMIDWCRENRQEANLHFIQGDAMDLPIDSNSVDIVLNLESSHCYPSRLKFFKEVERVLRPGGLFLLADILAGGSGKEVDIVSAQLSEAGLIIEDCTDITKNVLAARETYSRSSALRTSLRQNVPPWQLALVEETLLLTGTRMYKRMVAGGLPYVHWKTSKPAKDPSAPEATEAARVASS
jgi:ubiquinone/menaquinone biosynthesis C-methylase UbiE